MSPLSTKKRRFAFTASWSAVSVTSFGSVVKVYCLVSQQALIVWSQGKQLGSKDHVITCRPGELTSFVSWLMFFVQSENALTLGDVTVFYAFTGEFIDLFVLAF